MKVRYERDGDVAVLTIDAPPLNLFDLQLIGDLRDATQAAADARVRALLLRHEGEHFSAGAQVEDVFQGLTPSEAEARIAGFQDTVRRTEALPFPTLATARGLCLAAGLECVLTCDLLWAGESARFAFAEPVIGLTPIVGGVARLAARCGTARALEAVYTARPYPARTMHEWGVVNRVLPDADLDEKALAFAHRLAAGPTRAYEVTRRLVHAARDGGLAAADARSASACAGLWATADLAHGIESLLAHGPGHATFTGR